MKNFSLVWTVVASLFCSLSVTDALHDAGRRLQLAAVGNPLGVQRSLAAVALQMGLAPQQPAVVPVAVKAPVAPPSGPSLFVKALTVSDWVLHGDSHASADTLAGDAAKLFGLSNGEDVSVKSVNLHNERVNAVVFFAVIPGRPEVVLVRKDPAIDRTIYWLVTNGELTMTAERMKGPLTVVSGPSYDRGGVGIIDLFYKGLPSSGVAEAGERPRS